MKKFFITSILMLCATAYALACGGGWPTYNYYMFSVLDYEYHPLDTNTDIFWQKYSGGAVEEFDGEALMDIARKRGDKETQNYLTLLQDYLDASGANDSPWDYPSKEELTRRNQVLSKIFNATNAYIGSRYQMQYALLKMRANRALKRHAENITYWKQTASHFAASALRNRMEGIYAGALLKTGKRNEACEIFASLGDEESIKWVARHYCNVAGIRSFYAKDPNSPMLPYLVQRFVNNAQENLDTRNEFGSVDYSDWLEMLQVLPTEKGDVSDFIKFADEAAANPGVKTPCLYLSAAGFLHYLYGNQKKAEEYLSRAQEADGSDIQYDNLRCLRLLVSTSSSHDAASYESYLVQELNWLNKKIKETSKNSADSDEYDYEDNHYRDVLMRVVYHGLVPYYDNSGQTANAIMLLNLVNDSGENPPSYSMYGNYYALRLDSLTADEAVNYYNMLKRGGDSELQQWTVRQLQTDDNYYNDIIGTKMLREERWAEAVDFLEKVPTTYLNNQGIATYTKFYDYGKPRWMGKQHIPKGTDWEHPNLKSNKKIEFCKDMQKLVKDYGKASGENKYKLAYRLATLYYQASYMGDCWYLTQYGQSAADRQRSYAHDFVAAALNYLEVAKNTTDKSMHTEVLYARAFIPRDKWFITGYDEQSYEAFYQLQPQSRQFKALQELSEAARQGAPDYVTRCNVLKLFSRETRNGTAGRRLSGNNKYFLAW